MGISEKRKKERELRRSLSVARMNFYHSMRDIRWLFVLSMILFIVIQYIRPYTEFGIDNNLRCTWCLLPLIMQSNYASISDPKIILHVGLILLLCDAPFFRETTPYVLLRAKRGGWWKGECLYIGGTALLYIAFIVIVSTVAILPVISFKNSWNGIPETFLFGNDDYSSDQLSYMLPHYDIPELVIRYLYPAGTQFYLFLTCWASFTVLGLTMYLFSLLGKNSRVGIAAAIFVTMLDPVINFAITNDTYWLAAFSPVSWCSVDRLNFLREEYFLSQKFTFTAYSLLIVTMLFFIRCVSGRCEVDLVRDTAD